MPDIAKYVQVQSGGHTIWKVLIFVVIQWTCIYFKLLLLVIWPEQFSMDIECEYNSSDTKPLNTSWIDIAVCNGDAFTW